MGRGPRRNNNNTRSVAGSGKRKNFKQALSSPFSINW